MNEQPKWAVGAQGYMQKQARDAHREQVPSTSISTSTEARRSTGRVSWNAERIDFSLIQPSPIDRAVFRFKKNLPDLIWNAAALEGNTFTLPEVHTLLDGITVGGKRQEEAEQILALSAAMNLMIDEIENGTFSLRKELADRIHNAVASHEAIEAGHFRGEGQVSGGGSVRLARGGTVEGDTEGPNGELLVQDYTNLLAYLDTVNDARERALAYFASAVRSQFYFDGNKRTARIMMAGELMNNEFEAINTPFARQLEFNNALDELFAHDDATDLIDFLTTCGK